MVLTPRDDHAAHVNANNRLHLASPSQGKQEHLDLQQTVQEHFLRAVMNESYHESAACFKSYSDLLNHITLPD